MSTWVVRSPRQTDFWKEKTPGEVGPGTYNLNATDSTLSSGLAPFLVSSDKQTAQSANVTYLELKPGPGSYELEQSFKESAEKKPRSKSGFTPFVSKMPRWAPVAPGSTQFTMSTVIKNPGPGTYEVRGRSKTAKNKEKKEPQIHKDLVVQPVSGPPSIPTIVRTTKDRKGDTYAGRNNDTVGPAFYTPGQVPSKLRSKTADFGKARNDRILWEQTNSKHNKFTARDNPGPGAYDQSVLPPQSQVEVVGTASFSSKVKTADQQRIADEKIFPGPGAYSPSQTAKNPISFSNLQGFGSTTYGRDTWKFDKELPFTEPHRLGMPGVGIYTLDEQNRQVEDQKRKAINYEQIPVANAPFKTTADRDCLRESRQGPPGPGAYETANQIQIASYSGQIMSGNAKFGANVKRMVGLFAPKEGPGPGTYEGKIKSGTAPVANFFTNPGESYTVFKSTATRFPDREPKNPTVQLVGEKDRPPVGEFHKESKWGRKTRADDVMAMQRDLSFDTSSLRFNPKNDPNGNKIKPTPGPGTYRRSTAGPVGGRGSKTVRFSGHGGFRPKTGTNIEIGPGSYKTEGNLTKKSFNMTIEQPEKSWVS